MAAKEAPPTASGADRISALPDGVREHVLSFVPAHEAVRTTVLSHSWRDLWRKSPALRITKWGSVAKFTEFVDRLLRLRVGVAVPSSGPAVSEHHPAGDHVAALVPLYSCHFDLDYDWIGRFVDREELFTGWIQLALLCQVRVLHFCFARYGLHSQRLFHFCFVDLPLVSEHLTELQLEYVVAESADNILDFSGCPALVDLKMHDCAIVAEEMWSPSLQHLSMTGCRFFLTGGFRLPSLVSLELTGSCEGTPLLGRMPSLATAIVGLDDNYYDERCSQWSIDGCGGSDEFCEDCQYRYGPRSDHTSCLLLNGLSLSEATNLELSAHPDVLFFSRDLKFCSTFSKLKTLVLADWFVADDLSAVIWFLHHSPILEKLTLKLSQVNPKSQGIKESYKPSELSVASDHLKTVQIKCHEVDWMVLKILKILSASGIPLGKIYVQCSIIGSGSINFACTGLSSKWRF